jgi:hypothetical protein
MSHVVVIETKVHDPIAVATACQRLKLAAPVHGTAELFSGAATGRIVRLPGWQYPVVVDTLSGTMRYDHEAVDFAFTIFDHDPFMMPRGLVQALFGEILRRHRHG